MTIKKLLALIVICSMAIISACSDSVEGPSEDVGQDIELEEENTDTTGDEEGQQEGEEATVEYVDIGDKAPAFELNSLEGQTYSLEQMKGKPTLINFYSVNCVYCVEELPNISDMYEDNSDWANIVSVNVGEPPTYSEELKSDHDLKMPILLDEDVNMSRDYSVSYVPMNVFIDSEGVVSDIRVGPVSSEDMIDVLENSK